MSTTAAEFRTQLTELDAPALENCIAGLQSRVDAQNTMGRAFAGLGCTINRNAELLGLAREVLAERTAAAAAMVADAFKTAAEVKAEAAFDAMMDGFEVEIESEGIAQMARELAAEEDATAQLRRDWEWGIAA